MSKKDVKFESGMHAESFLNKHKVKIANGVITLAGNAGLKVLSAVDYLVNYHKFTIKFGVSNG